MFKLSNVSARLALFLVVCCCYNNWVNAQQNAPMEGVYIGFYNVENLFDTLDDPLTRDAEFLPDGPNLYGTERYRRKLQNLSRVISQMGTDLNPYGIAVLGLSEIENARVMEDLAGTEALRNRNYRVIHYDSPDRRGVDVGLLYNPQFFEPTAHQSRRLYLPTDTAFRTRDQLVVSGKLMGEEVHFVVAHWPSRSGGEKRSMHLRAAAGDLGRAITDSLLAINPKARIIYMGDLNDDPTDKSIRGHLQARPEKNQVGDRYFFNPMDEKFRQGVGSNAYRDSWSLFDQILVSPQLVKADDAGWQFAVARVFNEPYMTQASGAFKGYPYRTFVGPTYQGGYSDHFPVYVILTRPLRDGSADN